MSKLKDWSVEFTHFLGNEGDDAKFHGKVTLLDPKNFRSVRRTVDELNEKKVVSDCFVVQSQGSHAYYLIYRRGRKEASFARLQRCRNVADVQEVNTIAATMPQVHSEQLAMGCPLSALMAPPRKRLKSALVTAFRDLGGIGHKVNINKLVEFRPDLLKSLGLPNEAIAAEDFEITCERFDFSGNGSLEVSEFYSLVKWCLYDYMKLIGVVPPVDIPTKSLEQAGLRRPTSTLELGQGSQSVVEVVLDINGEERALKRFKKKDDLSPVGIGGVKEELAAIKLLACRNVGTCIECFQDSHSQCFCMVGEVYNGGDFTTLKQRALQQLSDLSEDWWRAIFLQCFFAIDFIHQQAMMHCDIKESNLMLKTSDYHSPHVMLIDFGVSKAMTQKHAGGLQGSPGYIPPETFKSRGRWFPVGDVFSMGVVMLQVIIDQDPSPQIFLDGIDIDWPMSKPQFLRLREATLTRTPPIEQVPFEGLASLCEQCLIKEKCSRPRALQLLADPWFNEDSSNPPPTGSMIVQQMEASHPMATGSTIKAADIPSFMEPSPASKALAAVIENDAVPPRSTTCPRGQTMVSFRTELFGYSCDMCLNGELPVGTPMYGANISNFHICSECINEYANAEHAAREAFLEVEGYSNLTWSNGHVVKFICLLLEKLGHPPCSQDEMYKMYLHFDVDCDLELNQLECLRLAQMVHNKMH